MNYNLIEKKIAGTSKSTGSIDGLFIGTLFHCRDTAHLQHLKTTSFAQHMALGNFYDEFTDLIDTLAETLQSYKGLLNIIIPESCSCDMDGALDYLKEERMEIVKARTRYTQTEIQNNIDEIIGLFDSTIYKLTFLKWEEIK